MIRLRALGALDLARTEGPGIRSVLAQPKRVALLAYLAMARPRGFHPRDRLLAMFWPDSGDERARAALSRAIYFLRRELGEGVIVNRGDEVAVDTDRLWCDAAAFEQHLERGARREALELYRGDLLPGFFTTDANGFEEWLERERTRLRDIASAAAWELAGVDESNGHLVLAAHWARRAVELAPFREAGVRRLLVLLDASGDRAGAVQAYEKFAAQLQAELELEPAPETQELLAEIRRRERVGSGRLHDEQLAPVGVTAMARPRAAGVNASPRARQRWFVAGVAVTIMVATPAVLLARRKGTDPVVHRVHVTRFTNLTGSNEHDALGRAIADRVAQSLAGTGVVHVTVPDDAGDSARGETAAAARQARAADAGIRQNAGVVVAGEVYRESGRLRMQAWITDVANRRVVWAVPGIAVDPDSISSAIDDLQERATGAIVALSSGRFATWLPMASFPPRFAAFQQFAQGVELQLRGAHMDAVAHLQRAVAADPTFIPAQLQLALAWTSVFREDLTDSIADALNRDRERLMPLQRHWLDWLLSLGAEDPLGAYRALKAADDLAPDRFGLHLAEFALRLNRPSETVGVLTRRGAESPYYHETAYWSVLAEAYHDLGQRNRELAAARAARLRYPDRIDVLSLELTALAAAGRASDVRALLDTALAFPRPKVGATETVVDMPGPGLWPGRLMITAATEFRVHGFDAAADETLRHAIHWYAMQSQADASAERLRFELAKAHYLARDWTAADSILRSLADADPANVVYLGFLGTIAARQGDSATARRIYARFDSLRPSLVRPHAIAGYWQSKISALVGDEERAIRGLVEAFGPQGRSGMHVDMDFELMRHSRAIRDFFRPKG